MAQEKAWFMVGEEKGEEDKAREMRAETREPWQGACSMPQGQTPL